MSAAATIPILNTISQQMHIYVGSPLLVAGVVGNILNIIIFLSLRTFRESSCAFYLTIMSVVNIGQLFTGLLSRIMVAGFNIDWTQSSLVYCKCRLLIFQLSTLLSYTCLCLATIDQYLATCSRPRWQQWCNMKVARRLMLGWSSLWMLHAIPYAIFFDHVPSADGRGVTCAVQNIIFLQYRAYFSSLMLIGCFPILITFVFGLLAYQNVQQLAYRVVPLVRRELDKQLTVMVLVQVLLNFLTDIPFVVTNALTLVPNDEHDPATYERTQFAFSIALLFFYVYFAVSSIMSRRCRVERGFQTFRVHFTSISAPRRDSDDK